MTILDSQRESRMPWPVPASFAADSRTTLVDLLRRRAAGAA